MHHASHLLSIACRSLSLASVAWLGLTSTAANAQEYLNGVEWKRPEIVTPGEDNTAPPSDAIVLFDGKDLSKWNNAEQWKVEDGAMIAGRGVVASKEKFGDCQLHIEWSAPTPPKGSGQGRGNSGVFFLGRYELQVLDSYDNETYFDGQAGAIYKQTPPMVNATRPPGQWNSYDVVWTSPRFSEDGKLQSPAYITAFHNGVLILNHFELQGDTPFNRPPSYSKHEPEGPLTLQDHGNPVRFRNIWVRPIKAVDRNQTRPPFIRKGDVETPIEN
ncbi:MAG: 3-keto-disaccharide hydrolase [Planctomycetaceae bacterium]